jgi:site-specific recombinase XerD
MLDLQASRRSPNTLKQYQRERAGVLAWCEDQGEEPELSRTQVKRYQVALLELGRSPSTVLARQAGVKRFSRLATAESEIPRDELAGLPQPQLETAVPEVLTDDQVRALLATCDKSFYGGGTRLWSVSCSRP